jgi:nucleoside-diphosphate-sugar epimerase
MDTSPFSEYGKSKLAGSSKVLEYPRSLVLRLFNVVGPGLQPLNPLTDIRLKVESALLNSGTIQLHNSFTVRDFISIDLFLRYLKFSVDKKLTGIYNVCSGVPVSFGDIALEIARRMGCIEAVESELSNQIDFVVGDPTKIRSISGIYEDVDTSAVVDWLLIR